MVRMANRTVAKLENEALNPLWLGTVLDDADAGILVESAEEIRYVNKAYARLLGYENPDQLLRRRVSLIVAEEDTPRLLEFGRMRTRQEPAPKSYDFAARCRDASTVRLHALVSASRTGSTVSIATIVQPLEIQPQAGPLQLTDERKCHKTLSVRETNVMEMILAGKRVKEIAFDLQLSPKTICTHRNRLLRKLQLNDNRELFQYALRNHIIDWS